mmetsp:Transcript_102697/g.290421  ORF Transcript_102697/g.290421 Transcript_102697/m.290421 type:complete len:191 (-) Transcript_102697:58-630(-)
MMRRLLRQSLEEPEKEKAVCFCWGAASVDQLLLCFPSLLADLARYVYKRSLEDLQRWLTVKIFVSNFKAGDFLNIDPGPHLFPEITGEAKQGMSKALDEVRAWLLGPGVARESEWKYHDQDGTYVVQGSLGASFADILRCSLFVRDQVVAKGRSLGICFCGPPDLCSWLRSDLASNKLPVRTEFVSECSA